MIRGALAVTTVGTIVAGLIITGHHPHHTRSASGGSAPTPTPTVTPTRPSRAEHRHALRSVRTAVARRRIATHADNGVYADTTMYCSTGNQNAAGRWPQLGDVAVADRSIPFGTRVTIGSRSYRVEDWIGWGSQFDIFGGDDEDCEQRALNYGRRHLRVVVDR